MNIGESVRRIAQKDRLAVQPRMGFAQTRAMQDGLFAVKAGIEDAIGTMTVDAFTRVGNTQGALRALRSGDALNGYPIASHPACEVRAMLDAVEDDAFSVQMRHGSADPRVVFQAAADVGITSSEGGPISYNLPYSQMSLTSSVVAWDQAVRDWVDHADRTGNPIHLETFGGCMYGQLCPPSLLAALSVAEAVFFAERGVPDISLSMIQGSSFDQDVGALIALERLAERYLPEDIERHTVFYSFMGLFPESEAGAAALICDSAKIARVGGAQRLIVKTAAEARGIPTVEENVRALNWARETADDAQSLPSPDALTWAEVIEAEAEALLSAVLRPSVDTGAALISAFADGLLDVPYVLHPCNKGLARGVIDPETGAVVWADAGYMPITTDTLQRHGSAADEFRQAISYVRKTYDDQTMGLNLKEV